MEQRSNNAAAMDAQIKPTKGECARGMVHNTEMQTMNLLCLEQNSRSNQHAPTAVLRRGQGESIYCGVPGEVTFFCQEFVEV